MNGAGDPPRLVVLRGNSGSGKSTVAQELRRVSPRRIAIVEQDYLRRKVLKERDVAGGDNVDLIDQTVRFALARGYDVVLEGILATAHYLPMVHELVREAAPAHLFYLDVSFAETLVRHRQRPQSVEFGEPEMREWYRSRDLTQLPGELVIAESSTLAETVGVIRRLSGL